MGIHLDSYYLSRTYAGVLEGVPTPVDVVTFARARLARMWGADRPVLIDPPAIKNVRGKEFVPQWCNMIWLNGPEMDRENHGSHLFVVWFTDEPSKDPSTDAQACIARAGGWEKHARDFQY